MDGGANAQEGGEKIRPSLLPRGNRYQRANIEHFGSSTYIRVVTANTVDGGLSQSRSIRTDSTSERGKNEHNHHRVTLS